MTWPDLGLLHGLCRGMAEMMAMSSGIQWSWNASVLVLGMSCHAIQVLEALHAQCMRCSVLVSSSTCMVPCTGTQQTDSGELTREGQLLGRQQPHATHGTEDAILHRPHADPLGHPLGRPTGFSIDASSTWHSRALPTCMLLSGCSQTTASKQLLFAW